MARYQSLAMKVRSETTSMLLLLDDPSDAMDDVDGVGDQLRGGLGVVDLDLDLDLILQIGLTAIVGVITT